MEKKFNFYLPKEMFEKFKRLANKKGFTVAGFLRFLIAKEIENEEKGK